MKWWRGTTLTLIAAAVAASGCGSDGGAAANENEPVARSIGWAEGLGLAARDAVSPTRGGAVVQIEEVLSDVQTRLAADRRFVVCGELTDTAQLEISAIERRTDFQACKNVIAREAARHRRERKKVEISAVLSVELGDGYAVARVRGLDGSTRDVPFVREATAWRLTNLRYAAPEALLMAPDGPGLDDGDPDGLDDPEAIAETIYDVQADFPAERGSDLCDELTEAGRSELEAANGDMSCDEAVVAVHRAALRAGLQPRSSEIVAVDVDGDRATAVLRDRGDVGKPSYRVPLTREDGRWLIPSLTLLEPIDLEPPVRGPVTPRDLGDPVDADARTEMAEAISDVQADFELGMSTSICAELSEDGRRELEALRSGMPRAKCENVVYDLGVWNRHAGVRARHSRPEGVRFDGPQAWLTVKDPGKPAYEVPFVRDDNGRWRLATLARVEPIAAAMTAMRQLRGEQIGGAR